MDYDIEIIGAGLAGSEAAWQAAKRGLKVLLYEMRPTKMTPAHHTGDFAELVCSNSLRSNALENAVGLLKEEMRRLDSLIMRCADENRVPAGGALAVDRVNFSRQITEIISNHPNIQIVRQEIKKISGDKPIIIATGPLTSGALAESIQELLGENYFYFYDAAAPILTKESLDNSKVFRASRYGKGDDDYLNCPMNEEEYNIFWKELINAEGHEEKEFEKGMFFEGCMPVEVMAKRGRDTLLYGPLKPVGLTDPKTGRRPHAVVQLRQDNREGTLFNIVGFQTHLKWSEQKRVFSLIPGLEKAEFVRFGVMHKNTFINSPRALKPTLQLQNRENVFFAGQITGVEGYIESAAMGLVAGINSTRRVMGQESLIFPPVTAHGALCHYITTANPDHFQPMNVTFGLLPSLSERVKDKKLRNQRISQIALENLKEFTEVNSLK